MNPKEEVGKIVDILNKEKQEEEIARQKRDVQQRLEEDKLEKRRQKLKEDFRNTGIEVLFKELISQKVVSNYAEIQPVQIYVGESRTDKHGRKISDYASMDLIFNGKTIGPNSSHSRISAIHSSNGLVIKGNEEFDVGIDCSLSEAIIKVLKNPMRESQYDRS